jgi:hypothetical protein
LRPALQFAGAHTVVSWLSFNLGIVLGQVLAVLVLIPALDLLFRFTAQQKMETTILAALAADLGWHRLTERAERLSQFTFRWPALDMESLAAAMGWLTIFLVLGGLWCLVFAIYRHRSSRKRVTQGASSGA